MGYKQKKNIPPMEREINYLLTDLCVKWGCCIPPDDWSEISKEEYYNSKSFAKDVVNAEGMDADYEKKWVRKISERFRERFGTDEIEKSTFVDRVRGQKENW